MWQYAQFDPCTPALLGFGFALVSFFAAKAMSKQKINIPSVAIFFNLFPRINPLDANDSENFGCRYIDII
jgi:hypothetical protein